MGFTGQWSDSYRKLVDMHARWLDVGIGRFISPDTIIPEPANPQSFNRYSYVNNRPLNFVDPSGHMMEERGTPRFDFEGLPDEPPDNGSVVDYVRWCGEASTYYLLTEGPDHPAYSGLREEYEAGLPYVQAFSGNASEDQWAWALASGSMGFGGVADEFGAHAAQDIGDFIGWARANLSRRGGGGRSGRTPSGPNAIGSRGEQLVAENMPHIQVQQYRSLDGRRIYDGYNTLTGNRVEIKTSTRGVYYHTNSTRSQVPYDLAGGNVEYIFVNCEPRGALATDLANTSVTILTAPGW